MALTASSRRAVTSLLTEVKQPNEDEDIAACRVILNQMQTRAHNNHRYAVRGAHAKSHGILYGELTVLPDLPEHLRQGIFAGGVSADMSVR